ncbi:hypothetical protein ACH5RR_001403 [Cinchona calisaya]|uniref:Uncharacterized protein n=1 Tax=Cinchona calisaya TaxID=153742 RepID=A0ABD3B3A6_9GENT
MVTDLVQGFGNCIWGIEVTGNISDVRFTGPISSHQPFSYNWPKIVPQPPEEPFVLYLPDSPPSPNLKTNHNFAKDFLMGDTDFESLYFFPDVKLSQNSKFPNFTKCRGNGYPLAHVEIFYNELGAYGKNEHLRL